MHYRKLYEALDLGYTVRTPKTREQPLPGHLLSYKPYVIEKGKTSVSYYAYEAFENDTGKIYKDVQKPKYMLRWNDIEDWFDRAKFKRVSILTANGKIHLCENLQKANE